MNEELKLLLNQAYELGAKYQIQYVDYDENSWTVPVLLTPKRIEQATSDFSVKQIRVILEL